jgi:hypothetical protein
MSTGTKEKKIHKTDILGNIGCFTLLILVIAWGMVIYNGVHKSINRGTLEFRADVTYQDGIVTLTNEGNDPWLAVWFSLDADDNPETYEYSYYISKIEARTPTKIDLTKFTQSNLYYYDPVKTPPKHLSLFAQTPGGTGRFVYTWK